MKKILLASFFLVGGLLAFYVFQINALINEKYQTRSYQQKIAELTENNKTLTLELAKINHLTDWESKVKDLGLERISQVRYLQVLEGQVVAKP